MITLLDYGAGNVRSVINAIERLGETVALVNSGADIDRAERLVFPGVGNFGALMRTLREKQLREPLIRYLHSGKPFFGICVALQALFESSEEAPEEPGLGILPGPGATVHHRPGHPAHRLERRQGPSGFTALPRACRAMKNSISSIPIM